MFFIKTSREHPNITGQISDWQNYNFLLFWQEKALCTTLCKWGYEQRLSINLQISNYSSVPNSVGVLIVWGEGCPKFPKSNSMEGANSIGESTFTKNFFLKRAIFEKIILFNLLVQIYTKITKKYQFWHSYPPFVKRKSFRTWQPCWRIWHSCLSEVLENVTNQFLGPKT